jgi:hypothetical protein
LYRTGGTNLHEQKNFPKIFFKKKKERGRQKNSWAKAVEASRILNLQRKEYK